MLEAALAAGYEGVQGADPDRCHRLGLVPTTFAIHLAPGGLMDQARRWADAGFACCTVMLGTGLEGPDQASRLVEEVLEASQAARLPLYVETHRATVTQDVWRTAQLTESFPELRFNGDFSHWYTGQAIWSVDPTAALDLLAPVLERVRYLHGRIGTTGCIQVDLGDTSTAPSVPHFQELWRTAFTGAIAGAAADPVPPPGLRIGFAPELLPPELDYAPTFSGPSGDPTEQGDRWTQALLLTELAAGCFAEAEDSRRATTDPPRSAPK